MCQNSSRGNLSGLALDPCLILPLAYPTLDVFDGLKQEAGCPAAELRTVRFA